jgi:hypothetical protein
MSTRGYFFNTSAAAARIESELPRSIVTKSTLRLAPPASFFNASPAAAFTSAQITVAPWRANVITVALPMPEAPPVTSAILPSNSISLSCVGFKTARRLCHGALAAIGARRPA